MAVQWQWQSDNKPWDATDPTAASWISYSPDENFLIEQAYLSIPRESVLIRNYYVVDVQNMIQYVQISPVNQRPIRRLDNNQIINEKSVRKKRFVFDDNENYFFQPFETNVKFGSLMIQGWRRNFTKSHRPNGEENPKDIVNAAIQGIEQEGLTNAEFRKEATEICDELRKVSNCKNLLDIKKCAVHLYTRNGILSNFTNKALRETDKRVYQNTLGPFCYLIYSYLCLRNSFGVNPYQGTVYRGAWLQPRMIGRFQKEMKNGTQFLTWLGFTSTTKSCAVADMFGGNTLFEIFLSDEDYFTSQGIDISHLSQMPDEEEVLLPPGFQFEISEIQIQQPTIEKQYPHYIIRLRPRQTRNILSENNANDE